MPRGVSLEKSARIVAVPPAVDSQATTASPLGNAAPAALRASSDENEDIGEPLAVGTEERRHAAHHLEVRARFAVAHDALLSATQRDVFASGG